MPIVHFTLLMLLHLFTLISLYLYLLRKRKLIGFQLAMNLTMVVAGLTAFSSGLLLIIQFPGHFTIVTLCTSVIGLMVGFVFGSLFDYQTALTGFVNGLMMGLMSPMIGSVMDDFVQFLLLSEFLYYFSIGLVTMSIKHT